MTTSLKTIIKRIGFYLTIGIVTILHFIVTFVVVLFVLSTLNIVNQNILHLEKPDFIEKVITSAIFIISAFVFFKSFRKMSQFIKSVFFKNPMP
jgi:hypothetical protein